VPGARTFFITATRSNEKKSLSSPKLSASSGVFEVGEKKNILRLGQFSGGTSLFQNFVKAQMLVNL